MASISLDLKSQMLLGTMSNSSCVASNPENTRNEALPGLIISRRRWISERWEKSAAIVSQERSHIKEDLLQHIVDLVWLVFPEVRASGRCWRSHSWRWLQEHISPHDHRLSSPSLLSIKPRGPSMHTYSAGQNYYNTSVSTR